jgi:hypothetical protein
MYPYDPGRRNPCIVRYGILQTLYLMLREGFGTQGRDGNNSQLAGYDQAEVPVQHSQMPLID